ncbi:MAG: hypothetical protein MZU97_11555 [Bacillus subtilis]|nr:hypothetical protein [Bacillus subtilis]
MPKEVKEKAQKELKRYEYLSPNSSEANASRTYLETLIPIPQAATRRPTRPDINVAAEKLDEAHYGLEQGQGADPRVPRRAAARRDDPQARSSASSGRPASARPRSAKSIARAMGREFVRDVARRRPRRGRDPRPPPHLRRRHARPRSSRA